AASGHLDSALVGDNPDQRKEREPARDLKHELAAPFHWRTGCGFLFSALTLGSISGFGVRSVSISENATKRPRRRRSRRISFDMAIYSSIDDVSAQNEVRTGRCPVAIKVKAAPCLNVAQSRGFYAVTTWIIA